MAFVLAAVLVASFAANFTLLAAIAAGHSGERWPQRVWLVAEMVLFFAAIAAAMAAALGVADLLGWQLVRRDIRVGLVGAVAMAAAAGVGGTLTYLEYVALGERQAFRENLRRSLWVGRNGARRWDGESR